MASRNASFHDGVLAGVVLAPLKLAFALALTAVLVLLSAWIVDWVFVFKFWPEGVGRLRTILAAELTQSIDLADGAFAAPELITATSNGLFEIAFGALGIRDMAIRFSEGSALSIPDTVVRTSYIAHWQTIEVGMLETQLLGVRAATLVLVLPLLLLVYAVAAADGLTQRAIRRISGGRESASLYHRAKHLQVVVGGMGTYAVLIWPGPVDWVVVAMSSAILIGVLSRVQWTYYKKHV